MKRKNMKDNLPQYDLIKMLHVGVCLSVCLSLCLALPLSLSHTHDLNNSIVQTATIYLWQWLDPITVDTVYNFFGGSDGLKISLT